MEYYVEKNSWGLLKTWWLQKTCLRGLQLKSPGSRMSSGKKRAQHLAVGKAHMNGQVREDKGGLTSRRGEGRRGRERSQCGDLWVLAQWQVHAKFSIFAVLFKSHIHSMNTLVPSLGQVLFQGLGL